MTTRGYFRGILLTTDSNGDRWQLGPLPPSQRAFLLVGWSIEGADGGAPDMVVDILVNALVQAGRVTFPCSSASPHVDSGWHSVGSDYHAAVSLPHPDGWLKRLAPQRTPSHLVLLSTRQPDAVRRMFDDAVYPWWLQAQFALLSDGNSAPPPIPLDPTLLARLIQPDWADCLAPLGRGNVDAILRPGVDGSVVGILCVANSYRLRIENLIRACATQRGMPSKVCSESEFIDGVADRTL